MELIQIAKFLLIVVYLSKYPWGATTRGVDERQAFYRQPN
jgi:hypothetical protein